jgi:hypothetical protein
MYFICALLPGTGNIDSCEEAAAAAAAGGGEARGGTPWVLIVRAGGGPREGRASLFKYSINDPCSVRNIYRIMMKECEYLAHAHV